MGESHREAGQGAAFGEIAIDRRVHRWLRAFIRNRHKPRFRSSEAVKMVQEYVCWRHVLSANDSSQ